MIEATQADGTKRTPRVAKKRHASSAGSQHLQVAADGVGSGCCCAHPQTDAQRNLHCGIPNCRNLHGTCNCAHPMYKCKHAFKAQDNISPC
jgi:hypothetical protein